MFRGDPSEFNQVRVRETNFRAIARYKHKPLRYQDVVVEIFKSERDGKRPGRVDWMALVGESTAQHRFRGRDSGDMLRGDNVRALAAALSSRLQNAQTYEHNTRQVQRSR